MNAPTLTAKGAKGKRTRLVLLGVLAVAAFIYMRRAGGPSSADTGAPAGGLDPSAADTAAAGAIAGDPALTDLQTSLANLTASVNDRFGHFQDLEDAYSMLKQGEDPFGLTSGGDTGTSGATDGGDPVYGPGNGLDWNGLPLPAVLRGATPPAVHISDAQIASIRRLTGRGSSGSPPRATLPGGGAGAFQDFLRRTQGTGALSRPSPGGSRLAPLRGITTRRTTVIRRVPLQTLSPPRPSSNPLARFMATAPRPAPRPAPSPLSRFARFE